MIGDDDDDDDDGGDGPGCLRMAFVCFQAKYIPHIVLALKGIKQPGPQHNIKLSLNTQLILPKGEQQSNMSGRHSLDLVCSRTVGFYWQVLTVKEGAG